MNKNWGFIVCVCVRSFSGLRIFSTLDDSSRAELCVGGAGAAVARRPPLLDRSVATRSRPTLLYFLLYVMQAPAVVAVERRLVFWPHVRQTQLLAPHFIVNPDFSLEFLSGLESMSNKCHPICAIARCTRVMYCIEAVQWMALLLSCYAREFGQNPCSNQCAIYVGVEQLIGQDSALNNAGIIL